MELNREIRQLDTTRSTVAGDEIFSFFRNNINSMAADVADIYEKESLLHAPALTVTFSAMFTPTGEVLVGIRDSLMVPTNINAEDMGPIVNVFGTALHDALETLVTRRLSQLHELDQDEPTQEVPTQEAHHDG